LNLVEQMIVRNKYFFKVFVFKGHLMSIPLEFDNFTMLLVILVNYIL